MEIKTTPSVTRIWEQQVGENGTSAAFDNSHDWKPLSQNLMLPLGKLRSSMGEARSSGAKYSGKAGANKGQLYKC